MSFCGVSLATTGRSALAAALLFFITSAGIAHEDRETRERGHEVRSERESREERKAREQDERRQRDLSRADRDRAEREAKAADDAEKEAAKLSEASGSSGSGSNNSADSDEDHSGSGSDDGSDDNSGSDDDSYDEGDDDSRSSAARIEVERDVEGRERRSDEVLLIGRRETIAAVREAGYAVMSERTLAAFDETLARIRVRTGESVEQTLVELRSLAPDATVAPHHVFRAAADTAALPADRAAPVAAANADIGVIDTGAEATPTLAPVIVAAQGFADGGYTPRVHGTLVASIASREGARLAVADVFGIDADNRLVASAGSIAEAIDWLVANRLRVINISIEGPDNPVLAHVVKGTLALGVAIVAAAGNGGPGAPPPYPAAYPGVIAVTAVDSAGAIYRRANRGAYIAFAARGVRVETMSSSGARIVSGTSFAAPAVAAAIVRMLTDDQSLALDDAIALLKARARDLGEPGRDATYGWGEIVSATVDVGATQ